MRSLFRKWCSLPLAGRILGAMVLGILLGLILHKLDKPLAETDQRFLRNALVKVDGIDDNLLDQIGAEDKQISPEEWATWLLETRAAQADSDGSGVLDRTELKVWDNSAKLSNEDLDKAAFIENQIREGLAATAGTDPDRKLTRRGLKAWLESIPAESNEVIGAVRSALDDVKGGQGKPWASLLAIFGDLFIGLIKSIVVPLVFVAVFVGIAGNDDVATVKKVGAGILVYFLCTTLVAVSLGSGLAVLMEPGEGMPDGFKERGMADAPEVVVTKIDRTFREEVKSRIPGNLFGSLSAATMLDIVLFAALFGVIVLVLREAQATEIRGRANQLVGWANFALEMCMTVVRWAMLLAPIGVFGLMTDITAQVGLDVLLSLFKYVAAVLLGLMGLLVFYSCIVVFVGKRSPVTFFKKIWELQLLAFSTSSSAAVMPRSLDTAENKLGIHRAISRFTIPLGATINMDGTALYQSVGAIFLMQVFGVPVTFVAVSIILATALVASIGTPGTPGVGIVVLAGILESNGVPASGIALIAGVDRLLDMCRTVINVTGDQTACIVMERLVGGRLDELEDGADPA
ncbi:MAG: cation:dicarboxylase symporter family transporter [Verrucomicrobiaceae bacterium]|nr:cation:dicarboxylase symporter family transporter [Verrucomicrobiaceae bacterium]